VAMTEVQAIYCWCAPNHCFHCSPCHFSL